MFIVPIGTERIAERGIPILTVGLAVLFTVVYVFTATALEESALAETDAAELAANQYAASPYTVLPETLLAQLPASFQETYAQNQRWTREYFANPGAASGPAGPERLAVDEASLAIGLQSAQGAAGLSSGVTGKALLFTLLRTTTPEGREAAQAAMDELAGKVEAARAKNLARRFGYTPSLSPPQNLLTHLFLHAGLAPLIFNLLFFIPAAASLEDKWKPPVFLLAFLVCGVAGALTYGARVSGEATPLLGAGGAVAGLLGAFLMRLWHVRVRFFYVFWVSLRPKTGSFSAPAGVMVPIWLVFEGLYGLIFSGPDGLAYWAQLGGFGAGAVLAILFRALGLERPRDTDENAYGGDAPEAGRAPMSLFAQEQARKRERWGLVDAPAKPAAPPSPASEPAKTSGAKPVEPAPSRPAEPSHMEARAPIDHRPPTVAFVAPASIQTRVGHHAPPVVIAAPPVAPRPGPPPPQMEPEEPAVELLPTPLVPSFTLAFKSPDRGAAEATLAAIGSQGLALREAIRIDDDRAILAAFVRAAQPEPGGIDASPAKGLDSAEALRLSRALADEGFPRHAIAVAGTSVQSDPSGPFAARLLVLAARLLYERGIDRGRAITLVDEVSARFPGDPIRAQAADFAARWRISR